MIQPLPSKRSAILTGMIAATTLFVSVDAAQAGAAEQKALLAQLQTTGKDLSTATATELANAVTAVLTNNAKFKPGIVAGEALKSVAGLQQDAGDEIANAISAKIGTTDRAAVARAVGDAAKTAGTSKGANVSEVPAFTQVLLNTNDEARQAALFATASKAGVGAIFGGRASEITAGTSTTADQERANLVTGGLIEKKLQGSAQSIAQYVAAAADDSDAFTLDIAQDNIKFATKIVAGAAAGVPGNAGEIVRQVAETTDPGLKKVILKGALGLAKTVGAVADIEQIVLVGKALADKIGDNALDTNGKALIKATQAAALTKTLAKAIIAKPNASPGPLTPTNKQDEVAEVAAFVAGGIIGSTGVTIKTAPKLFLAIIKAAVAGGKATKKQTALVSPNYIQDIAGSVALTVQNSTLPDDIKLAVKNFLIDPKGKQAKAIGGRNGPAVTTALTEGFTGGNGTTAPSSRYEDGNIADLALADPETDKRNF